MEMDVQIKWTPKTLEKNLNNADNITEKTMKEGLQEAVEITATKARGILDRRALTKGNKNLINSLENNSTHSITKVFSHTKAQAGTKYPGANLIEEGTKPHTVPWTPIENWISENKSVLGFTGVGRATHLTRELIANKGTKAIKYMEKGVKEGEVDIDKAIEKAADKILERTGLK